MKKAAFLFFFLSLFACMPFISGIPQLGTSTSSIPQLTQETTTITFNNNSGSVNNTFCWDGICGSINLSQTFVPYVGANKNVNIGTFNLSTTGQVLVGSIGVIENPAAGLYISTKGTGVRNMYINTSSFPFDGNYGAIQAQTNTFQVGTNVFTNTGSNMRFSPTSNGGAELSIVSQTAGGVSLWANPQSDNRSLFIGGYARPVANGITFGKNTQTTVNIYSPYSTDNLIMTGNANISNNLFTNTTHVGIGTSTPLAFLHVAGSGTTIPAAQINGTSTASASSEVGILKVSGSATNALVFGTLTGTPFAGYIQSGGSSLYPLSLNPNGGNVGIGTTTPNGKLDIHDSSSEATLILNESGSSRDAHFIINKPNDVNSRSYIDYKLAGTTTFTEGMLSSIDTWGVGTSTSLSSYKFVINATSGNIGIGTVSPSAKLFVDGNTSTFNLNVTNKTFLGGQVVVGRPANSNAIFYIDGSGWGSGSGVGFVYTTNDGDNSFFNIPSSQALYVNTKNTSSATTTTFDSPALRFRGNSWNGIANTNQDGVILYDATGNGTGLLSFRTAEANRLTIDQSGNVTIGSEAGKYNFQVTGNTNLSGSLYIPSTGGNVGIQTNSPFYSLHINNTAGTKGFAMSRGPAGNMTMGWNGGHNWEFDLPASTIYYHRLGGSNAMMIQTSGQVLAGDTTSIIAHSFVNDDDTGMGTTAANVLDFYTNGTKAITIDASQRVGIGSTNPIYSLDVNKTNSVVRIGSGVDNSGTATVLFGHRASSTDVQQKNAIISSAIGDWGRANLHFAVNTAQDNSNVSTTNSKLMISGSTGNVGIGTVTPSQTLDVRGLGNFSGTIFINNNTDVSLFQTTSNTSASYVPYVGAIANLNMNQFNITNIKSISASGTFATSNGTISFGNPGTTANISAIGRSSFAFGDATGINSSLLARGISNFAFGDASGANSSIVAGVGNFPSNSVFVLGSIGSKDGQILASGQASLTIGEIISGQNSTIRSGGQGALTIAAAFGHNNTIYHLQQGGGIMAVFSNGLNTTIRGLNSFSTTPIVFGNIGAPNSSMFYSGVAPFVHGGIIGTNNSGHSYNGKNTIILGVGDGAFLHGYINNQFSQIDTLAQGAVSIGTILSQNSNISSSGIGSIAFGTVNLDNNKIISSNTGTVAIGFNNLTSGGIGSIAFGNNISVIGNYSLGIGLGGTHTQMSLNKMFYLSNGDFFLNGTTNPFIRLGQAQQVALSHNSSDFIINPKTVGTGKTYNLGDFIVSENLTVSNNTYFNSGIFASNKKGITLDISFTNATGNCFMNFTSGLLTGTVC